MKIIAHVGKKVFVEMKNGIDLNEDKMVWRKDGPPDQWKNLLPTLLIVEVSENNLEQLRQYMMSPEMEETVFLILSGDNNIQSNPLFSRVVHDRVIGYSDSKKLDLLDIQTKILLGKKLFLYNQKLNQIMNYDDLTGLLNYSTIIRYLKDDFERVKRYKERLNIALIDIDHLRFYNAKYGTETGDQILKSCAEKLGAEVRNTDKLGRFNGDSFLLIMPEIKGRSVKKAVSRIQKLFLDKDWSHIPDLVRLPSISIAYTSIGPNCSLGKKLIELENLITENKEESSVLTV